MYPYVLYGRTTRLSRKLSVDGGGLGYKERSQDQVRSAVMPLSVTSIVIVEKSSSSLTR